MKHLFYILLLSVFGLSCESGRNDKQEVIKPVKFERLEMSNAGGKRTFSGISVPASETELSFRIGGVISELEVEEGDQVQKGQQIAEVGNIEDQLDLQGAGAQLKDAKAQLETAKANYYRVKKLFESNIVSVSDYEKAKSELARAKADYATARQRVGLKQQQVSYSVLNAPVSGIITEKNFEVNEAVNPGEVVVVISSGDSLEIDVGVPESFVGKINKGDAVKIRFSSQPDYIYRGSVVVVPYSRSYESAAYKVSVSLDTVDPSVRPGMSAKVTFESFKMQSPTLLVPSAAVSRDQKGTFVFVIDSLSIQSGVVHRRSIEVGELTTDGYEVRKGLEKGELVVTAGVAKLSDGMQVKLIGK